MSNKAKVIMKVKTGKGPSKVKVKQKAKIKNVKKKSC